MSGWRESVQTQHSEVMLGKNDSAAWRCGGVRYAREARDLQIELHDSSYESTTVVSRLLS